MNEVEFTFRIRQALNEGADRLPYRTRLRLENARRNALARHKATAGAPLWVPALRFATRGGAPLEDTDGAWMWVRRLGLLAPMIALAMGFVGIYRWHHDQAISEHANLDLAVLLDDTPIDTYADRGFGELMRNEQGI
jgi:Protein of unknown function (DUF3619)